MGISLSVPLAFAPLGLLSLRIILILPLLSKSRTSIRCKPSNSPRLIPVSLKSITMSLSR